MNRAYLAVVVVISLLASPTARAANVTCKGTLIEVHLSARDYFAASVIYDNTDEVALPHTCVLDVGHAGHWPLRGVCQPGEQCVFSGPYYKKIFDTYYMRLGAGVTVTPGPASPLKKNLRGNAVEKEPAGQCRFPCDVFVPCYFPCQNMFDHELKRH